MNPPAWPADDAAGIIADGRPATATHRPATVAELQDQVRAAVAAGLAVYPRGGGTTRESGGVPARPGVVIETDRLDRVIDYPAADMTITVEAGMTLGAIRAIVAGENQRLAIESPNPDRATLGGIFATARTGPRRFGWGRPRDAIIGVAFVNGAGDLVRGGGRVVKNVAGYDLPKLLTGSWGTLGIITELTLKVNPRPEASAFVAVQYSSLLEVAAALDRLNTSGTRPIALELVDTAMAGISPDAGWTLSIGLEGNEAAVAWQVRRLETELGRPVLTCRREAEAEAAWLDLVDREAADLTPVEFRASFAPSAALRFVEQVPVGRWAVRAHAGNGVVRGWLRSASDLVHAEADILRLRAEANRLGGALVLAGCPTDWKARLGVWGERRPDWALAERVKAALDPGRVLNPGRFVGTI